MRGRLRKKAERLPDWVTMPLLTAAACRVLTRQNALDPRLAPTDRHLQRWAAGQGAGLPDPDAVLVAKLRLDPLPHDEAVVTDQVVLTSPSFFRRFVHDWYRHALRAEDIATRLGFSRDRVFEERRLVLAYYLGRLTEAGVRIATFESQP